MALAAPNNIFFSYIIVALEVKVVRYCYTLACWYVATYATGAVVACTCLAVAHLQTVCTMREGDRTIDIVLLVRTF